MVQRQLYSQKNNTPDENQDQAAIDQLEAVKRAKIEETTQTTRMVKVKVKCLTCRTDNDGYHEHEMEVPDDSPIVNGDYIYTSENWGTFNFHRPTQYVQDGVKFSGRIE